MCHSLCSMLLMQASIRYNINKKTQQKETASHFCSDKYLQWQKSTWAALTPQVDAAHAVLLQMQQPQKQDTF